MNPSGPRSTPGRRRGAVATRSLGKTFGAGGNLVHALRDLNLDIEPGAFVVVLGPSGSGKTTLLNVLGGLDTPSPPWP